MLNPYPIADSGIIAFCISRGSQQKIVKVCDRKFIQTVIGVLLTEFMQHWTLGTSLISIDMPKYTVRLHSLIHDLHCTSPHYSPEIVARATKVLKIAFFAS